MKLAEIAVNVPLDKKFHYIVPEGMEVSPLLRVKINFAGRSTVGIVMSVVESSEISLDVEISKLKELQEVLDEKPVIDERTVSVARWMTEYCLNPFGENLFTMVPVAVKPRPYKHKHVFTGAMPVLNPEQRAAFEAISPSIGKPEAFLLHGVTGSGKTEVYKHLVRKTLDMGKNVIVLIPEISLTPQTLERFFESFGDEVAIYHSKLSNGERMHEWLRALHGEARVMIGPRSAIFTPMRDLGLIIIDEEHESSYKAANSPRYHARQVAFHRSAAESAALVLGSATPLVETYFHAVGNPEGKNMLRLVELKSRYSNTPLPLVEILDMRGREKEKNVLAVPLIQKMLETLAQKKQVLLFLNRRGFSPVLICRECGHTFDCPRCNVSLTYHLGIHRLVCHHCGHTDRVPEKCPSCGSVDLTELGTGTERIEQLLIESFPGYKVVRMDLDTTRTKDGYREILDQMKHGEADILVGTQMVAKGHDIAGIHLVGVVLPDIILNIPDFRSSERTFILLTQVIGRAGRRDKRGEAMIQTFLPENEAVVCAAKQDYAAFYESEIKKRRDFRYPPFCRLGRLVIRGVKADEVKGFARELKTIFLPTIVRSRFCEILGPVSCPIEKLKNNYRYHIIIKSPDAREVRTIARSIRDYHRQSSFSRNLYLEIDIDPVSMV
jgi:primosomal protein N' (replication factor Y)